VEGIAVVRLTGRGLCPVRDGKGAGYFLRAVSAKQFVPDIIGNHFV